MCKLLNEGNHSDSGTASTASFFIFITHPLVRSFAAPAVPSSPASAALELVVGSSSSKTAGQTPSSAPFEQQQRFATDSSIINHRLHEPTQLQLLYHRQQPHLVENFN